MSEIITVGLDLAKNVFQVHGADGAGRAVLRKKLRREQVLAFELPRVYRRVKHSKDEPYDKAEIHPRVSSRTP